MARDRQLPSILAKIDPKHRVPVNATLFVAVISLVLGIYMSTRDDGITLLSTLVNFGALSAFLVLHVAVVWHFIGRRKSKDYWRHLAVPVIGFGILLYVVINAQVAAQTLGFTWLGIGVVVLVVLLVTGRKPELKAEEHL
jgi:amino acid transporter